MDGFAVSSVGGALLHEDITGFSQLRRIAATLLTVDHSPWRAALPRRRYRLTLIADEAD